MNISLQSRYLYYLLCLCWPFATWCQEASSWQDATQWQAQLEQIQLQSKSAPRDANLKIDQWLTQVPIGDLALREQLINIKAFNLVILSEHTAAEQLLHNWLQEVQAQHPQRTTRALEISGYIAMRRGDHATASKLLRKALEQATYFQQHERQITTRIYTAMQAMYTGQFDVATALLLQAKALNDKYKFTYLHVNIHNNLSALYIDVGQYQQALTLLNQALTDPAFLPADLLYVRMNLASAYLGLQQYDQALPYALEALAGYQQRNDPFYLSQVYLMLTQIARHQQKPAVAQQYLQPALALAHKHHLNEQLSDGYLLQSELQQQAAQFAPALKSLQLHLQYYKAYHNEAAQDQALALRSQIDSLQHEQDISALKQQVELNALKTTHQTRISWMIAIATSTLILLLLMLIQLQRRKRAETERFSSELASSYQQLQHTQQELVTSEKMAAIAGMVAGLAHELNTPLGILTTAVSLAQEKTAEFQAKLQQGLTRQDLQQYLATSSEVTALAANNIERCAALVQNFKQLAVGRSDVLTDFNLQLLITDISTLLGSKLQQQRIQLNYADTELMLHADVQHFQLLLIELLNNALLHAFGGRDSGCIELRIHLGETHFELLYQDDGVGFAQGSPDKVFEPFFTTSRSSGHTGLGLNLVYNLVTVALSGEIKALPVSQGFTLCCRLPNRWLATPSR
ncbi:ATP-binding protein [Rheinheimera texasensis]|uniref:ATP-binding protein n=1 Tax=Rheinheimera texasensis TaxID=306205 RepID=UPI0032B25413